MNRLRWILFILFFSMFGDIGAQSSELNTRLSNGELKMRFPGIYFEHNSTEYAKMPYRLDSCFMYIAKHVEDIKNYVIWRDSAEPEGLTQKRLRKIKAELKPYVSTGSIHIESMKAQQKISRYTMRQAESRAQFQYLLTLNSVFEVSVSRLPDMGKKKKICWFCILHLKRCQVNTALLARIRGRF